MQRRSTVGDEIKGDELPSDSSVIAGDVTTAIGNALGLGQGVQFAWDIAKRYTDEQRRDDQDQETGMTASGRRWMLH